MLWPRNHFFDRNLFSIFCVSLYFSTSVLAGSEDSPQELKDLQNIAKKHLLLGDRSPSFLPSYASVLKSLPLGTDKINAALDDLALAVTNAKDPAELSRAIVGTTTVEFNSKIGGGDGKYGAVVDRDSIVELLWSRAKDTTNEGKRIQLARAAVILGIFDIFPIPAWHIGKVFRNEKEFEALTGLSSEVFKEMHTAYLKFEEHSQGKIDLAIASYKAVDSLFQKNLSSDQRQARVKIAIDALGKWYSSGMPLDNEQWSFAFAAWTLRNHLKNDPLEEQIETSVKKWMNDTSKVNLKKWLGEALEKAEKPARLYGHVKWDGNKFVDVNDD